MRATKPLTSARVPSLRVLFATVTLAFVVLTCVGIQSVANWVAAPHPSPVSVQALDATAAAASTTQQAGGFPIGIAIVALLLAVGVRFAFRARAAGSKVLYWDDMPW